MLLKDFEDTLKNIENDRMLMSYGDNQNVVSSILSVVNLVQSLSSFIKSDRVSDMFTFNISSKVMELENIIVMYGNQRLLERGISMQGNRQFNPSMQQQPMYNPQMYYQNMNNMYNPMMGGMPQQQQQMPQMPQQGYNPMMANNMPQQPMQPQMPQYEQPAQQAPPQPAPTPAPAQNAQPAAKPAAAPKPAVNNSDDDDDAPVQAPPPKKDSAPSFSLPGMSGGGEGGESARGRDYLLKLLEEN